MPASLTLQSAMRHRWRVAFPLLLAALAACQPPLQPLTAPRPDEVVRASDERAELTSDKAIREATVRVFGDSLPEPLDGAGPDTPEDNEPSWDIDVASYETNDRVAHYVQLFSGTARDRIAERLTRGSRYDPMIRAKFRAGGLPEDLSYLALIESGYDTHAYSRSAAVGMWQFMTATGKEVGLRIDWWMDERRDPARATDAAVKFLSDLQRQFGSFYLAAAAYNGGPGRVSRGLTQFASKLTDVEGDDRFFALAEQDYLHSETKNYVPQLIAAAIVGKTPARFGLNVETLAPYVYDSVLVEENTALGAVARAAAIPLDTITELNPAILRGTTPPGAAVWLRVPTGSVDVVETAIGALSAEERRGWTDAEPKKGESLTAFAKRQGVTSRELGWYNPGLRTGKGGVISAGQTVRVPASDAIVAARVVPDPAVGGGGSSASASGTHLVRSGESLSVIAARYGMTVSSLKSLNGLRSDRIRAGQRLRVRGGATTASNTAARATATRHTVRSGESLGVIAQRYGTSVRQIRSLNGLSSDRIRTGQTLRVR